MCIKENNHVNIQTECSYMYCTECDYIIQIECNRVCYRIITMSFLFRYKVIIIIIMKIIIIVSVTLITIFYAKGNFSFQLNKIEMHSSHILL
jgi:hypothetical protein